MLELERRRPCAIGANDCEELEAVRVDVIELEDAKDDGSPPCRAMVDATGDMRNTG